MHGRIEGGLINEPDRAFGAWMCNGNGGAVEINDSLRAQDRTRRQIRALHLSRIKVMNARCEGRKSRDWGGSAAVEEKRRVNVNEDVFFARIETRICARGEKPAELLEI